MLEFVAMQWLMVREAPLPDPSTRQGRDGEFRTTDDLVTVNTTVGPRKRTMAEPPIQNLDSVDILGTRKDGGADLVISVSGPLDDSTDTLKLLEAKIRAYISAVATEGFRKQYIPNKSKIIVSCAYPVSEAAHRKITELEPVAAKYGVTLQFRESMSVH